MSSLISVKGLSRYYDSHCAVNDINFEVAAGDILGFLGPNGAGKSTTMQMLSGNLAPSGGEILINGIDLLDDAKRAKLFIGYLPEKPPLYIEMSVDEFLRYCALLRKVEISAISAAIKQAKTRCGLADCGHRLIKNLSKGFQQRVGIAQAILHSPDIIILDEPTVGLDPIQIKDIRELIVELGKEHGVILSTHILPEVLAVCNRVQIINKGKLVYTATMTELMNVGETAVFEVTLHNLSNINDLNNVTFVNNVERITKHDFIIHMKKNYDAEDIAKTAIEQHWGLQKIIPKHQNLEQIFINLAINEDAGGTLSDTVDEYAQ